LDRLQKSRRMIATAAMELKRCTNHQRRAVRDVEEERSGSRRLLTSQMTIRFWHSKMILISLLIKELSQVIRMLLSRTEKEMTC